MHQEFDPRDLEPALPSRDDRPTRSKVAPIMIALVALAGFGGVVWYAYDQGVRQPAAPAATPLIKADNGPTKVRPDQPGGMDVPHQDKLVLNTLPEGDKAGNPPVERLLPPAETPLPRPTPTASSAAPTPGGAPSAAPSGAQSSTPGAPPLPPKIGPAPPPSAASAPVVAAPVIPAAPAPAQTATAAPPAANPAPAPPPAPAPAKPAAAPAAPPPPKQVAAAKPPAPATGGAGYKVQLVSVKSQDQASQEWARLQQHFPELASLHMTVARADLGDRGVYYRVQAGPLSDAAAAGQLCHAITAKDKTQGCMVVKP